MKLAAGTVQDVPARLTNNVRVNVEAALAAASPETSTSTCTALLDNDSYKYGNELSTIVTIMDCSEHLPIFIPLLGTTRLFTLLMVML